MLEQRGLLAFKGAAGDDEAQIGSQDLQELRGLGFGGGADIKFEISGDGDPVWLAADGFEAVGICFGLGKNACDSTQQRPEEGAAPFDSAARSGRRCGR